MEVMSSSSSVYDQPTVPSTRKVWRIGSLSMGITLIMIGVAFAASLWQEFSALVLMQWVTPFVFIMLGGEVLLQIKFVNHERYEVKFDWLGTFFVAIVGIGALIAAAVMSTGIFDEMKKGLNLKQQTLFVQEENIIISEKIDRIVVKTFLPVQIEEHDELSKVQLTGSIQYESAERLGQQIEQYMHTQITSSTLYIFINNIDQNRSGFVNERVNSKLVLNVPSGKEIIYN